MISLKVLMKNLHRQQEIKKRFDICTKVRYICAYVFEVCYSYMYLFLEQFLSTHFTSYNLQKYCLK